jgi:endonuclease/exonuclease/phosphatase family metal-dependent hydrolase
MPWGILPAPVRPVAERASLGGLIGGVAGYALGTLTRAGSPKSLICAAAGALAGGITAAIGPIRDVHEAHRVINRERPGIQPASQGASDAHAGAQLRIMTVNIRSLRGAMGMLSERSVLDQISRAINRLDPDVVVLQEVDSRTLRSPGADQVDQLARRVGATDAAFLEATRKVGGAFGQGIILRNGVRAVSAPAAHAIPQLTAGEEHRIAVTTRVVLPDGTRLTVVGAHLATDPRSRAAQIASVGELAQRAGSRTGEPVVIAGDFNDSPQAVGAVLAPRGYTDALTVAGVHPGTAERRSFISGSEIDHVFVSPGVGVQQTWVSGVGMAGILEPASDHRAVIADLAVAPTQ